jgi:hypothetical protein
MYDAVNREFIYMVTTIGTVVDSNDPQQNGRVRILVPAYGDRPYANLQDLPWAIMASPFMGIIQATDASRGASTDNVTDGQVAYGFWNTPKVGASVLVTCINGDPMNRVCMGCIPVQAAMHTMPHGRYFYDTAELNNQGEPEGPLSSREQPIQPLYDNQTAAFGSRKNNYEYRTRGADNQITGIDSDTVSVYANDIDSKVPDDMGFDFTESDGNEIISIQGYRQSRQTNAPVKNSNVSAWVTSGFHAISMDDSVNNCRIRLRTAGGFQIILDDTNERMYLSSSQGANWMELDQDGNIYVFGKRFSVHATEDINFTADNTIRMFANGIHMVSTGEMRIQTTDDLHISTSGSIRTHATESYFLEAGQDVNIKGGTLFFTAGQTMNLLAGANLLASASQIQLNGPQAGQASSPEEQEAFWTNIVPQHEPWGRVTTLDDFTHDPFYPYDSDQVGRQFKVRGPNWHR